jgi:hypothetical protein
LNDALDVVDAGNRNMETPVAIAPRDRAGDASVRQFIESVRREQQEAPAAVTPRTRRGGLSIR